MIYLSVPGLPPSSNHAYFNLPKGGRALTKEGKKYKNETIAHLAQNYRKELMYFKKDISYQIIFRFTCQAIQTQNWKPGSKLNRYKKFDGGNLTKLLEDCLKDAGGIDDSQTLISAWQKKQGLPEKTEIYAWNLEEEHDPFDLDFTLDALRR